MPDTRTLRVFLCHASQDKPIVRELYQRLARTGWTEPWLDEEDLLPGQAWEIQIEKAVEETDVVLICLSQNSITKEGFVQRELRLVLNAASNKPEETIYIIPIRLDNTEIPKRLRTWQYVDYFPPEKRAWSFSRVIESLKLRAIGLGIEFPKETTLVSQSEEEESYNRLCIQVFGNEGVADRLIEFERRRYPASSRAELIDRALERLMRDMG